MKTSMALCPARLIGSYHMVNGGNLDQEDSCGVRWWPKQHEKKHDEADRLADFDDRHLVIWIAQGSLNPSTSVSSSGFAKTNASVAKLQNSPLESGCRWRAGESTAQNEQASKGGWDCVEVPAQSKMPGATVCLVDEDVQFVFDSRD